MLNILVVDDSIVMRRMVIKTLRMSGIPLGEVHEAANGAEGLEIIGREWIDLAMVDLNMPVLDGQTMIERLRASDLTRDLAVLVVSTDASATRREALKDCRVSFVEKPFTPEQLREEVLRVTGLEESHDVEGYAAAGGDFDF
jgi:two-component system, chemotaxis family, chemotaxis protein CheY